MPRLLRPQSADPAELARIMGEHADQIETAEPWREIGQQGQPAFNNAWANLGGNTQKAAFRKNVLGQIELKGEMTSPAVAPNGNGTSPFTLPTGYFDPATQFRFVGIGISGVAAETIASIVVSIAGVVTILLSGVAANAVVTRVSISGIVYRVPLL